jgi:hypothetical protein
MTVNIESSVFKPVKYVDGHSDVGEARQVLVYNHIHQNEKILSKDLCCNILVEQCIQQADQNESVSSEDDTQSESKSSDGCESLTSEECDDSVEDDLSANNCLFPEADGNVLLNLKEVVISKDVSSTVQAKNSGTNATHPPNTESAYRTLHITYLLITLVIMLADGLQGKLVTVSI